MRIFLINSSISIIAARKMSWNIKSKIRGCAWAWVKSSAYMLLLCSLMFLWDWQWKWRCLWFFSLLLNLFPPIGFPHPAMTWRFVFGLIVTYYAMFGWHTREVCSFLKGNWGEEWICGRGEVGEKWKEWREGKLLSRCNVGENNTVLKKKNQKRKSWWMQDILTACL